MFGNFWISNHFISNVLINFMLRLFDTESFMLDYYVGIKGFYVRILCWNFMFKFHIMLEFYGGFTVGILLFEFYVEILS